MLMLFCGGQTRCGDLAVRTSSARGAWREAGGEAGGAVGGVAGGVRREAWRDGVAGGVGTGWPWRRSRRSGSQTERRASPLAPCSRAAGSRGVRSCPPCCRAAPAASASVAVQQIGEHHPLPYRLLDLPAEEGGEKAAGACHGHAPRPALQVRPPTLLTESEACWSIARIHPEMLSNVTCGQLACCVRARCPLRRDGGTVPPTLTVGVGVSLRLSPRLLRRTRAGCPWHRGSTQS